MAEITDRIPFVLHPVCGWIALCAEARTYESGPLQWEDYLWGWAAAKDGHTAGPTWNMILEAIESERNRG